MKSATKTCTRSTKQVKVGEGTRGSTEVGWHMRGAVEGMVGEAVTGRGTTIDAGAACGVVSGTRAACDNNWVKLHEEKEGAFVRETLHVSLKQERQLCDRATGKGGNGEVRPVEDDML